MSCICGNKEYKYRTNTLKASWRISNFQTFQKTSVDHKEKKRTTQPNKPDISAGKVILQTIATVIIGWQLTSRVCINLQTENKYRR